MQFLIPLFLGWAVVWGASWVLPPRYESSTLILVEQPTMPKDYVTPNVNDDLQERMQSITQQILSRTRLLHIIDQFNLYAAPRSQPSPDQKVERMRKDIDIELVRDARNQITAFNVSYTSRDPRMAQQVTSELTNLFISENLEVRQQQSEDTTTFLESQLETARKSLSDQEAQIREFKGQHVGEMPGQLASNLQILSGLQSQLQNEQDSLNAARQQHVYLQTLARLPEMTVILYPDPKDDERAIYVPVEPCDPFTEAVRTALEIDAEVIFIEPDSGEIRLGPSVKLAYVDQSRQTLNDKNTVWQEISGGLDIIKVGNYETSSRSYVGRFNFKGVQQQQFIGDLSGGERNRVHLAKVLKAGGNVLLLDEPTNDLDIETLRALEEALTAFPGCAVVISHDRWFLDRIATHILAFEGDSQVTWFEGNYQEYEEDYKRRKGEDALQPHRIRYKPLTG